MLAFCIDYQCFNSYICKFLTEILQVLYFIFTVVDEA